MIPRRVAREHIEEAIRLIIRYGVPRRRRSRGYCLATKGEHLPPKYTISLAHQVATGEMLRAGRFSGGSESNEFLRLRGFTVIKCNCGGSIRNGCVTPVFPLSARIIHDPNIKETIVPVMSSRIKGLPDTCTNHPRPSSGETPSLFSTTFDHWVQEVRNPIICKVFSASKAG